MGFLSGYEEMHLADLLALAQGLSPTSERAMNEVVRRFEGLTRKIGQRTAKSRPYRDDVENAARLALTRAVRRHTGGSESFPAYARLYMTGAALREVTRWQQPSGCQIVPLDETTPMPVLATVETAFEETGWGHGDTADAIASLPPAQRRLVHHRYAEDADLAEIATRSGTTVAAVSQRLGTIHRRLQCALAA